MVNRRGDAGLALPAPRSGADADESVEDAGEVALVAEAAGQGDPGAAVVGPFQQFRRVADALAHQPAKRRRAHADPERADEMAAREAATSGDWKFAGQIAGRAAASLANAGSGDAVELATYIVEKGRPLVVLAR